MIHFCSDCHRENSDDARFCMSCGLSLTGKNARGTRKTAMLDNRYEILSEVKSGAMGCVYRAMDHRLNEVVAVKKMLDSFTNPEEKQYAEERFTEEARLLFKLQHSGLPKVSDFFDAQDPANGKPAHYLVMTFIEGKDLGTIIRERNGLPLPVTEALDYFYQILLILYYLHSRNPPVIYRDLNPRNIMIHRGKVYLVDFGIAQIFVPQRKGTAIGTPGYAAPEQYKGAAEPRSDLYSLGAVMHHMLTGVDPEDNARALAHFESPGKLNPEVSEHLDTLIMSMLQFHCSSRPLSAEDIINELGALWSPQLRDGSTEGLAKSIAEGGIERTPKGRANQSTKKLSKEPPEGSPKRLPHPSGSSTASAQKPAKNLKISFIKAVICVFLLSAAVITPLLILIIARTAPYGLSSFYISCADNYYEQGSYDEAKAAYTNALKIEPKNDYAYYSRGYIYAEQGEMEKAIDDFTRAIENNPDEDEYYYCRGYVHYDRGSYKKAVGDYTKAIKIKPDDAVYYNSRGCARFYRGTNKLAIKDFTRALELCADSALYYANRAEAFYYTGNYSQTLEDSTKALEIEPDDAFAHFYKGLALEKLGRPAEALKYYKKFITLPAEEDEIYLEHEEHIKKAKQRIRQLEK